MPRLLLSVFCCLLLMPQAAAAATNPGLPVWLRPLLVAVLVTSVATAAWTGSQLVEREKGRTGASQPLDWRRMQKDAADALRAGPQDPRDP